MTTIAPILEKTAHQMRFQVDPVEAAQAKPPVESAKLRLEKSLLEFIGFLSTMPGVILTMQLTS